VNTGSIDIHDVKISGKNYTGMVEPASANFVGSGTTVTATYTFNAPGGSWDPDDYGTYTITQIANQVLDINGNPAQAGTLGTFKALVPFTYVVDNIGDVDDANYGPGQLTLREAVNLANTKYVGVADIINFDFNLYGLTIVLGSQLEVTDSVVI